MDLNQFFLLCLLISNINFYLSIQASDSLGIDCLSSLVTIQNPTYTIHSLRDLTKKRLITSLITTNKKDCNKALEQARSVFRLSSSCAQSSSLSKNHKSLHIELQEEISSSLAREIPSISLGYAELQGKFLCQSLSGRFIALAQKSDLIVAELGDTLLSPLYRRSYSADVRWNKCQFSPDEHHLFIELENNIQYLIYLPDQSYSDLLIFPNNPDQRSTDLFFAFSDDSNTFARTHLNKLEVYCFDTDKKSWVKYYNALYDSVLKIKKLSVNSLSSDIVFLHETHNGKPFIHIQSFNPSRYHPDLIYQADKTTIVGKYCNFVLSKAIDGGINVLLFKEGKLELIQKIPNNKDSAIIYFNLNSDENKLIVSYHDYKELWLFEGTRWVLDQVFFCKSYMDFSEYNQDCIDIQSDYGKVESISTNSYTYPKSHFQFRKHIDQGLHYTSQLSTWDGLSWEQLLVLNYAIYRRALGEETYIPYDMCRNLSVEIKSALENNGIELLTDPSDCFLS